MRAGWWGDVPHDMTGHTPGPWHIDSDTGNMIGSDGSLVWRVSDDWDDSGDFPNDADARLIAAAPELLAACVALTARLQSLVTSGDCGNWSIDDEESYVNGKAAIAKATAPPPGTG